ncbi:MAG: MBL fold metallo-hydrolase [Ginsengibacter sp.]
MLQIQVLTFNPVQENTYLLFNEKNECIIIDPGCYYDNEKEALTVAIGQNNLRPKMLLNTHCHLDHVFGNKFIAEKYNLTLHLHKAEEQLLKMAPASGLMFNLPFDNYAGEFIFLNEGDIITLGADKLEVIHAPGHSPGSICFYCKEQKFIISGDVLFNMGIGRTDLPGGSHEQLISSIKDKLFLLPDDVTVYNGHGIETSIGYERKNNPFLV